MSTPSILKRDKNSLQQQFEETLIEEANTLYIKDKFLIDCGLKDAKWKHTLMINKLFSGAGEELDKIIKEKLEFKQNSFCNHPKIEDYCKLEEVSTLGQSDW